MSDFIKKTVTIEHHGREIFGISYMPQQVHKCPVVIFSHGFNGTHAGFSMHSEYLASNGVGAFSFDFCGGSVNTKSDLQTSEMSIFTEKDDLSAVIDHVSSWDFVDPHNIFLFGESQGGLVSALAAEEHIDVIKGMLLLYPALCIADDWNRRFLTLESIPDTHELWGVTLGRVYFESIHGYDVFQHIGSYNKNVLIFHGDQDEIVPIAYGRRASLHYARGTIEEFTGEGHGFSETGNRRVAEQTLKFVEANR